MVKSSETTVQLFSHELSVDRATFMNEHGKLSRPRELLSLDSHL
jgi:hypothetical protein